MASENKAVSSPKAAVAPLAVSVPTAARLCGLSPATFWELMKENKAPRGFYVRARRLVLVADLEKWLLDCQKANPA